MRARCVRFKAVDTDGKKSVLWCRLPPRVKVVAGIITECGIGVALPLEVKRITPTCTFCKNGVARKT